MNKEAGAHVSKPILAVISCAAIAVVLGCYAEEALFQRAFFIMDHSLQNYPFRHYVSTCLQEGTSPLWCPYIGAGFPLFAEGQSGVFFPLNFITAILVSGWKNYSLQVLLTLALGALGMVLYLDSLKLRTAATFFGSVVWCLNGYILTHCMFINLLQTCMMIPFALYFIEKLKEKYTIRVTVLLTVSLCFILLAGHPQSAFIALIFILPYYAVRVKPLPATNRVTCLIILTAAAVLLSMAQLLPSLTLFADSARQGNWSFERMTEMSLPPHFLLSMLMPYYYGNPADSTYWGGNFGYFWNSGCIWGFFRCS